MNKFYFVTADRRQGMKQNGSFTKDRSAWMIFDEMEVNRMRAERLTPYGATHRGRFEECDRV